MSILNLKDIQSAEELETIARKDLEGKTLIEIAKWIGERDIIARVNDKGAVGYVIEDGYFGIPKNSTAGPDIEHLGVEVKTSPLKMGKDGKLRVKEPLSLNIINYNEEYKNTNIKQSSLYKKNKKILFVWYIHNPEIPRSQYIIKYVFLWEMNDQIVDELNEDYLNILGHIKQGKAHDIHQHQHQSLTLCPKHNGVFKDPNEKTSKTSQPFSDFSAEVRAFRLKNRYMKKVIQLYLLKERPNEVKDFVALKQKL